MLPNTDKAWIWRLIRNEADTFFGCGATLVNGSKIEYGEYTARIYSEHKKITFIVEKNGQTPYNETFPKIEYKDNDFFFTSPDNTSIPLESFHCVKNYLEPARFVFTGFKSSMFSHTTFSYSEDYDFKNVNEYGYDETATYTFSYVNDLPVSHFYNHTRLDEPYAVFFSNTKSKRMEYRYISPSHSHEDNNEQINRKDNDKPSVIILHNDDTVEEFHFICGQMCRLDLSKPTIIRKKKNGDLVRRDFYSDISLGNTVPVRIEYHNDKGDLYKIEKFTVLKEYPLNINVSELDNMDEPSVEIIGKNKVTLIYYVNGIEKQRKRMNKYKYELKQIFNI